MNIEDEFLWSTPIPFNNTQPIVEKDRRIRMAKLTEKQKIVLTTVKVKSKTTQEVLDQLSNVKRYYGKIWFTYQMVNGQFRRLERRGLVRARWFDPKRISWEITSEGKAQLLG